MKKFKHKLLWPLLVFIVLALLRREADRMMLLAIPDPYGPGVVSTIGILMLIAGAVVIDRLIRIFYWDGYLRRRRSRDTPALIEDIFTIALIVLGASIGLSIEAGVSFAGLLTASGATAIVLGIALQVIINDVFSGLSLNIDNSYAIGDWLTVFSDQMPDPVYGQVQGISWRSTFLLTLEGQSMMVPNHLLTSNPVINHSRPKGPKKFVVEMPVSNEFPIDRAANILLAAAYRATHNSRLSPQPEPDCLIDRYDSDSTFFHIRFAADPNTIPPAEARSLMASALGNAVLRHKVPSPVDQIQLMRPFDAEEFRTSDARAVLARVAIFKDTLDQGQIDTLFAASHIREIPADRAFIAQGEAGNSMFVILEGAARVSIGVAGGQSRDVAVLSDGDIIGEMSLMTGAPRTATVKSLTQLRIIEVTKDAIEPILAASPAMLERFGHVLAMRQADLARITNAPIREKDVELDILARMTRFFSRTFGGTAGKIG